MEVLPRMGVSTPNIEGSPLDWNIIERAMVSKNSKFTSASFCCFKTARLRQSTLNRLLRLRISINQDAFFGGPQSFDRTAFGSIVVVVVVSIFGFMLFLAEDTSCPQQQIHLATPSCVWP